MTRRASYCILASRRVIPTQWCRAPPWFGTFVVLDHLRARISWDCSVTSTPNQLAFVDTCLSLPHAKQRDQGYIWRGAYTGKNLIIRDHMFFNVLKWLESICMLSKHKHTHARNKQTCSTSHFSGNQVDGLQLVAHSGEDDICPEPHP